VLVGVFVGVSVGVLVGVSVGVLVGVFVGVFVGVLVGVGVGLTMNVSAVCVTVLLPPLSHVASPKSKPAGSRITGSLAVPGLVRASLGKAAKETSKLMTQALADTAGSTLASRTMGLLGVMIRSFGTKFPVMLLLDRVTATPFWSTHELLTFARLPWKL